MLTNYKNLITKNLLLEEYIGNKKSTTQIGKLLGCSQTTILRYLKIYDIPRRSKSESIYLSHKKHYNTDLIIGDRCISNYKNLLTKNFLIKEYTINKKSTTQIGKQIGCSQMAISRYLRKYDIPRRDISEAIHLSRKNNFIINELSKNYIDGLIISDGCINNCNHWCAGYNQGFSIKYKEWAEKIQNDFKMFGIESKIIKVTLPKRIIKNKITPSSDTVILYTKKYEEFLLFRKRWYSDGIKKIPDNLEISPEMLANWYLGDGTRNQHYKSAMICSLSFDRCDLIQVSKKLNKKLNINSVVHKMGIYINRKNTKRFLDYIEPFKVSCFDYKWGY